MKINYTNLEAFENDISNSTDITILNNTITIADAIYNRGDIKSDESFKYVIYTDANDKFSWFEIYFTTNPFKFNKLEDYTI